MTDQLNLEQDDGQRSEAPVGMTPPPSSGQSLPTSGLAIAGMVLGIVALVTIPLPFINFGSPLLAIIGLILSIVGRSTIKKGQKSGKGIATAGIVLCAIVTALALLVSASCSAAMSSRNSSSASAPASAASASATSASAATASASSTASSPAKSDSAKPAKEGFDPATNKSFELAGVKLEIPKYYGKLSDKGVFSLEQGQGTTIVQASEAKADVSSEEFENGKKNLADNWAESASHSGFKFRITSTSDATIAGMPAMKATIDGSYEGGKLTGTFVAFFNPDSKSVGMMDLVQSGGSEYDYFDDFEKVLASAKMIEGSAKESSQARDSDESADPGQVDPDLKEALDSYEAFMDEYVEFMETYKDSDDTTSMLADYADYMQRYADFVKKIDGLDTDSMSAADYAYYIEVTSRVSEKLINASV